MIEKHAANIRYFIEMSNKDPSKCNFCIKKVQDLPISALFSCSFQYFYIFFVQSRYI